MHNVVSSRGNVGVFLFDEVDTGIGGATAVAVGAKLRKVAAHNQVICITHLPQIATFADHHFLIEKSESGGRTRTSVRAITGRERTEEIARMLSGAEITEEARAQAQRLLAVA